MVVKGIQTVSKDDLKNAGIVIVHVEKGSFVTQKKTEYESLKNALLRGGLSGDIPVILTTSDVPALDIIPFDAQPDYVTDKDSPDGHSNTNHDKRD